MEHKENLEPHKKKNVPRGTIFTLILILIFALSVFTAVDRGTYIEQSILERKNQYLSIPLESTTDLMRGNGLGNYVQKLIQKSPGLFQWQYQPIHNGYILLVFEIGLLPLATIALYFWQKRKKYHPERQREYTRIQVFIITTILGLGVLFAVDHYTWDIEQGQFLLVTLLTFLVFSFKSSIPKNIK